MSTKCILLSPIEQNINKNRGIHSTRPIPHMQRNFKKEIQPVCLHATSPQRSPKHTQHIHQQGQHYSAHSQYVNLRNLRSDHQKQLHRFVSGPSVPSKHHHTRFANEQYVNSERELETRKHSVRTYSKGLTVDRKNTLDYSKDMLVVTPNRNNNKYIDYDCYQETHSGSAFILPKSKTEEHSLQNILSNMCHEEESHCAEFYYDSRASPRRQKHTRTSFFQTDNSLPFSTHYKTKKFAQGNIGAEKRNDYQDAANAKKRALQDRMKLRKPPRPILNKLQESFHRSREQMPYTIWSSPKTVQTYSQFRTTLLTGTQIKQQPEQARKAGIPPTQHYAYDFSWRSNISGMATDRFDQRTKQATAQLLSPIKIKIRRRKTLASKHEYPNGEHSQEKIKEQVLKEKKELIAEYFKLEPWSEES